MTTTQKPIKLNLRIARKVLSTVDAGLVRGLGKPIPGQMCVEAAVNYAIGNKHGDDPKCVGKAVRDFKIKLNDCDWSSNEARTEGMRRLAIAQLGSDSLDQMEFGKLLFLRGTQQLLSWVFRQEAKRLKDKKLDDLASRMEQAQSFDEARSVAKDAYTYAYTCAYAYAYTYTYAYAYAYASTYAYAYDAAYAYAKRGDKLLRITAQVGLDVLIEMKSPGCKWLWLCDEE